MRRPKLGISSQNVSALRGQVDTSVPDGVMIWEAFPGGAAANAGLHGVTQTEDGDFELGDIIVSIDGEPIKSADDLSRVLEKHQLGQTVSAEVVRNGRRMTVQLRLTEAPDTRRGIRR